MQMLGWKPSPMVCRLLPDHAAHESQPSWAGLREEEALGGFHPPHAPSHTITVTPLPCTEYAVLQVAGEHGVSIQGLFRVTDRVVSALQPTWLIGLGRARTRDQPISRRKGYPDRFRGSPPRSSVDAMPDVIVLFLPCQVAGDVTPTPCAPPSKGRPLAPAEAYPAARGVRRQGVGHRQQAN